MLGNDEAPLQSGSRGTGTQHVVIVGAGQAGLQLAMSLRDEGFAGNVTLIGDETDLPYQRPPLSKAYLKGEAGMDNLRLRPEAFFHQHRVTLRRGERVARLERAGRQVVLASSEALAYEHLVLATGARNRRLDIEGAGLEGILQLRSRPDADALKEGLAACRKLVIVGAGFIGLECASVARALGKEVTVVEAADRPMPRTLSAETASAFFGMHDRTGVKFIFEDSVTRMHGDGDGRVIGVVTRSGREIPADLVLVGIGVLPNVELAAEAGLAVANGIVVDAHLLTADPSISAIGDCSTHPSRFAEGAKLRFESVQNAIDQARSVAARLVGRPEPYASVPWFWSDQGKWKLQIAGLSTPYERTVRRNGAREDQFSVLCFSGGKLAGVESVNSPADHMAARKLFGGGAALTLEEIESPSFDLRAAALAAGPRVKAVSG
ncbi:MAG: FAD-dependent oxidoreductase [Hyphomicrobiales bacterium]|nr:FAD-dependent oxidoreductase [Hyphomicrobiales bacterium]